MVCHNVQREIGARNCARVYSICGVNRKKITCVLPRTTCLGSIGRGLGPGLGPPSYSLIVVATGEDSVDRIEEPDLAGPLCRMGKTDFPARHRPQIPPLARRGGLGRDDKRERLKPSVGMTREGEAGWKERHPLCCYGIAVVRSCGMCRNIRTLFNFEPPVTEEEIRAASPGAWCIRHTSVGDARV